MTSWSGHIYQTNKCTDHDLRYVRSCKIRWRSYWTRAKTRVPGLPIRDCTTGCNNCAHMCAQLSEIDVTEKTLFERCISSRIGHIWALSQVSLCTHNPAHSLQDYFSISEFPRIAPQFFWYAIHQVSGQSWYHRQDLNWYKQLNISWSCIYSWLVHLFVLFICTDHDVICS